MRSLADSTILGFSRKWASDYKFGFSSFLDMDVSGKEEALSWKAAFGGSEPIASPVRSLFGVHLSDTVHESVQYRSLYSP